MRRGGAVLTGFERLGQPDGGATLGPVGGNQLCPEAVGKLFRMRRHSLGEPFPAGFGTGGDGTRMPAVVGEPFVELRFVGVKHGNLRGPDRCDVDHDVGSEGIGALEIVGEIGDHGERPRWGASGQIEGTPSK